MTAQIVKAYDDNQRVQKRIVRAHLILNIRLCF